MREKERVGLRDSERETLTTVESNVEKEGETKTAESTILHNYYELNSTLSDAFVCILTL